MISSQGKLSAYNNLHKGGNKEKNSLDIKIQRKLNQWKIQWLFNIRDVLSL